MNVDVTEKRLFLMDQIQSGQKDVYKTYNERMEYSTAILHSCIITPASLGYCNSMTCFHVMVVGCSSESSLAWK